MQNTLSVSERRVDLRLVGWGLLLVLTLTLWVRQFVALLPLWRGDHTLTHGPLVPLVVLVLLWQRRSQLQRWEAASFLGLMALVIATILYVGAYWVDLEFFEPLALIGMVAGGIWFLGGGSTLLAAVGPLGFLIFMSPWPAPVIDHLAFPMQILSSKFAALFGGMIGIPVYREGVQLAVLPDPNGHPVYSIVVARACSGLTSLIVLLALAYLVAYHTPIPMWKRVLLAAAVVPMAVLTNALRLTIVLFAGAHHSAAVAQWIHDHEGPVLIALCAVGLIGIRHLLTWKPASDDQSRASQERASDETLPAADH